MMVALAASFWIVVITTCFHAGLTCESPIDRKSFNGAQSHPTQHCLGRPGDAGLESLLCQIRAAIFGDPILLADRVTCQPIYLERQQHRVENTCLHDWVVASAVGGFAK